MKFSEQLWQKNAQLYQEIIEHPFNKELMQGVLNEERFSFYMSQDSYYLIERSRSFALIAARADPSFGILSFLNFATEGLIAQHELHTKFSAASIDWNDFQPSMACLAYTKYLVAMAATAPLDEAIAALLPCFWIYRELGVYMEKEISEDNPYANWICTYAEPEFSKKVDRLIAMLDKMTSEKSKTDLIRIERAFEYGCRFEWHFFDDAYEMKTFSHLQKIPCLALTN